MLRRLARLSRRQALAVVAGWLVLVALAMPFASRQNERLTSGGFDAAGSQSARVEQTVRGELPGLNGERMGLVLAGGPGAPPGAYAAPPRRLAAAPRPPARRA